MRKDLILKKVIAKLEWEDSLDTLISSLEKYAIKEPRNIIKLLQTYRNENKLSRQDSIKLMGKIQQKGIIDKSLKANKDAEKAWRLLLKTWGIPSFRLERGAY